MFPHKLFLLERNRWSMLLANLARSDPARALAAARPHRADDVGLLPAPRADVPAGEARLLPLDLGQTASGSGSAGGSSTRSAAAPTGGVLRGLHWGYPLDQFVTLGRERGESERNRIGA